MDRRRRPPDALSLQRVLRISPGLQAGYIHSGSILRTAVNRYQGPGLAGTNSASPGTAAGVDRIRLRKANLEREIELFNQIGSGLSEPSRGGATRGGGRSASLQSKLPHLPPASETRKGIRSLAANWNRVIAPYPGGRDMKLDDHILGLQRTELARLPTTGGDPSELLNALDLATIR
jgi:hypothetical protein